MGALAFVELPLKYHPLFNWSLIRDVETVYGG
jgi:hypothetical protein